MVRVIALLIASSILYSCASRKVTASKVEVDKRMDSVYVERKDSVSIQQNSIKIKEESNEIEVTPIDTTKPIIIGETKYYNAKLRIRKGKKTLVDSSKVTSIKSQEKLIDVNKQERTIAKDKKVDKKPDYSWVLWVLAILAIAYCIRRYVLR